MKFINLRNYTENTLLNAAIKVPDLINKAKEEWLKAVAMTDKFAYGMIPFYRWCLDAKIKPLFGLNLKSQWWLHNIIVFPKSEQGKENIFTIATWIITDEQSWINGFKNTDILKDIIFIVDYNTFSQFPDYYTDIIEKKNLYIELQPRNLKNDFEKAVEFVWLNNIIITSPLYYLEKNDEELVYLMKSIEQNTSLDNIANDFPWFYFKNTEDIKNDFQYLSDEEFNTILKNINNIVDEVDFKLDLNSIQIPVFEIEWEPRKIYDDNKDRSTCIKSDEWYLRYLTYNNLESRYWLKVTLDEVLMLIDKEFDEKLDKTLSEYLIPELKEKSKEHWSKEKQNWYNNLKDTDKNIIDRAEYELFVIHKMWFNSYFLIVSDYINWSRNNWDLVWPWRGSAAWSIVSFLSWITDIDPLQYDLLFERFLNPSRVNMPDVDTDFSNRDNVIHYCSWKYGSDHVTPVITYWKLTARTVLKWVSKWLWINYQETNRITALITPKEATWHVPLESIYEQNQEFREAIDASSERQNAFEKSKRMEWFKQQTGSHACAVIIAPKPLTKFTPLQYPMKKGWIIASKDNYLTQLEGWDMEALGLLKMDFLWLQNLTIMNDCQKIVKEHKNIDIDLTNVDVEDTNVFETIFKKWKTTNVFQFESQWMKKYLKGLAPNNIDDLIAMVSLYRPWPIKFIQTYINRKHGIEDVIHPDKVLEPIMGKTYWICVTWDSKVLFENWEYKQIKDIVDNKIYSDKNVLSINMETNKIESKPITHLFNNGEKEFLEISFNDNSTIKSTPQHKYLIYRWITDTIIKEPFENTLEDDIFISLKNIPESTNTYSKNKLLLIAYLLWDGYLWHSSGISFINKDKDILDNFINSLKIEFPTSNIHIKERWKNVMTYHITDTNNRNNINNKNATLLTYLREIWLKKDNYKEKGLVSNNKHIPDFIFNLDNDSINHFIAKLWDCDWGIDKKWYGYYTSISKELIQWLSLLLKKVWIKSNIYIEKEYITSKWERKSPYHLNIKDKIKFNNNIGLKISSKNKLSRCSQFVNSNFKIATKISYIPKWIILYILEHLYKNISINSIDKNKYLYSILYNKKTNLITRERFNELFNRWIFKYSDLDKLPKIKELIDNYDFYKVSNVVNIWKQTAYDLEVADNHNYFVWTISITNCVYQEQIMKMAQDLAWYSLGEADLLRRAVWKKKKKIILEQRAIFVEKAVSLWHNEETTGQIYDDMILPAAEYSFNKSHAACYAFIAYQWAFLKTYYPAEYNTAILKTQWTDLDRVKIAIEDALIDGINIIALDINKSKVDYEYIDDKNIKLGLKVIKGIWENPLNKIVEEREKNWEFTSIDNFIDRCKLFIDSKVLTGLFSIWALDWLLEQNKWLTNIKRILNFTKKNKKAGSWQVNLFDMFPTENNSDSESNLVELEEPTKLSSPMSRAINEMTFQWFMLKNHPFDWMKDFIEKYETNRKTLKWTKNTTFLKNDELEINGFAIIMDVRPIVTKKGDSMVALKLLWTDYFIGAMIGTDLTHKFEYELIGKNKKKPSWIYKMIQYKWKFSINDFGRTMFLSEVEFKDIDNAYIQAEAKWMYNKNSKCDWKTIYEYKNEVLDYKKTANIIISDYLFDKENENSKIEKLTQLKKFLLKYNEVWWEYHVILKNYWWDKIIDTKMSINDKDALINYIEKVSWLKTVGIKRTTREELWLTDEVVKSD